MCTTISPSFIKSDEKQKSFINSPFFCSEFQSVSRIAKIVHSESYIVNFFVAYFMNHLMQGAKCNVKILCDMHECVTFLNLTLNCASDLKAL